MNQYLIRLARQILSIQASVSKVCFAKTIYFVHKGLVLKKLSNSNDLEFIRMPLGPVPVGFDTIECSGDIKIRTESTGLIYNKQNYYLINKKEEYIIDKNYSEVQKIVNQLSNLSTSELVESSHKEPTWLKHVNSDRYYISSEDLRKPLPLSKKIRIDTKYDDQHLQAYLLGGMIEEIVSDSTELEYPSKDK